MASDDAVQPAIAAVSTDKPKLTADELGLLAQGHEQELPRSFSAFAVLSLGFVITNSWIGYAATMVTPLWMGGGPMVVYGLLAAFVACMIITAGMAELASAYPSSGGQYHFTFMVASPKTKAAAAFIAGWFSVLAWALTAAGASIYCAQVVVALAVLFHPSYVPTQWQIYLVYLFINLISVAIICYAPKILPMFEKTFFWSSVTGFLAAMITVLACSRGNQSPDIVFVNYNNLSGWNDGTSFLVGLATCMYAFVATDATTHIAEARRCSMLFFSITYRFHQEVSNPGKHIPQVMIMTMIIGMITVFPFTLALLFSSHELDAVANSFLPILEFYHQATGNRSATAFFTFWLLWNYFGATVSCIATTGRLTWAFARDNGLPASSWFAKVHAKQEMPLNATWGATIFLALYGLIYIGSTTAFNSFISLSILALNVTYVIPQGILLFRGRNKVLPERYFKLGRLGAFVNGFACLWMCLFAVIMCFPYFVPPKPGNMNYVSVVVVAIGVFVTALWYGGKRKTFVGPIIPMLGVPARADDQNVDLSHVKHEHESATNGSV
ncbi:hypothetical protein ZTR_04884 [Talaromyces verruculosus]|nr:hypothetical protein ZTR_04884 [Talaromyces verruculosus]